MKNPVVTTGTFDGVHFGHQKIIDRLKSVATKIGGESVLLTFHPHPRMVLFPD
ncbi:MAG: adenylyltransferase/cytidyltransferase family protein, partial [Flavobacteriales bacterium]|nr:adenylyltransferase/cytidyltransferase family protein [Flavobacteriales bacterium]